MVPRADRTHGRVVTQGPVRLGLPHIPRARWAGGFQYIRSLAEFLRSDGTGRVAPVVLSFPGADPGEVAELARASGLPVAVDPAFLPPGGVRLARSLLLGRDGPAFRAWERAGVDVVFQLAAYHGSRPGRGALAWIPDLQHQHMPGYFPWYRWWRREIGFRLQLRAANAVLVSSETARGDVARWYPSALPKVHVARFPATPASEKATPPEELRRKYQLPERFLFLPNQLWSHKNHLGVIEALVRLEARGVRPVVISTGGLDDPRDPGLRTRVTDRIRAAGLADRFRLLGLVPRGDVNGLLRGCHALVNPSHFEGWSTTVEEALLLGVPLAVSGIPVHLEQVGAGRAVTFDPADPDAIATALAEVWGRDYREARADWARSGLERASELRRGFVGAVEVAALSAHETVVQRRATER